MPAKNPSSQLDLDRLSLWIVLTIIFFIIVVSVYQLRTNLHASQNAALERLQAVIAENKSVGSNSEDAAKIQADQSRDDDGDGLNNFEEVAQYGTSPYLVDTDSDTITDAEEIAAGSNPTCPEGEACEVARVTGDGTTTDAQEEFDTLTPTLIGDESPTFSRADMETELQKRGITAQQLETLTDKEVSDLYLEAVQQAESGADPVTNVEENVDTLLSLSTEQKRKLLIDSGVPSTDVEGLSDDEVNALVQEAVDQVLESQGVANESTQDSSTTETAPEITEKENQQ